MSFLPKIKTVKTINVELCLPEEKPTVGKVSPIGVNIQCSEPFFFQYALFELVNERTDKRAPMDRITSRSRYLYKYNKEEALTTEDNKYNFDLRIPVHKEPSRNDKFIYIRWQLSLHLVVTRSEEDSELLGVVVPPVDLEVV